jgi:WD40 repeat protein
MPADAPDLVYSSSEDGTVRSWDFRSGQQTQQCAISAIFFLS